MTKILNRSAHNYKKIFFFNTNYIFMTNQLTYNILIKIVLLSLSILLYFFCTTFKYLFCFSQSLTCIFNQIQMLIIYFEAF